MKDATSEKNNRSRRAVMTGGAVLLGGAVLGSQGTADAADGKSLLMGKSNAAKAMTKLTASGNNQALNVTNSSTGTQAHGVLAYTKNGYGLLGESTGNSGGVVRTHNKVKPALLVQNLGGTDVTQAPGITSLIGSGAQQKFTNAGYGHAAVEGAGLNGVIGVSTGHGTGVLGHADGKSGTPSYGIYARGINGAFGLYVSAGPSVIDIAATAGANPALTVARSDSNGPGVLCYSGQKPADNRGAVGQFSGGNGVTGATTHSGGFGVSGSGSGQIDAIGVWALSGGGAGSHALIAEGPSTFYGDVHISGTLSKSGGSFRIDHPQDPAGKYLSHSFVESPDMKNVYDGVVTTDARGAAAVELPDWFETLNRDFRYQLTPIGGSAPELNLNTEVANNVFTIAGAKPHQKVSWQVTGIRQDAWANENRIPVEETKPKAECGTYLYPEGFGKPASAGRAATMHERNLRH